MKYGDIVRVKDKNEEVVVLEERDPNSVSTMDMLGNTVPYRKDMVEKVKPKKYKSGGKWYDG